jgi:DNA invertase Pin-like site-specific DNA recombinase
MMALHNGKFVAYYRVSTARQGRSGLGLEAQRQTVLDYLNGGRRRLVAEHTEVESGAVNERPELVRALAACRIHGATLVVAKLDRLSRDAAFLLNLKASGVRFTIAEMPEANELTVDLLAVLAQHERRVISERTKAALAAAKRRGVRLGNPGHLDRKARRKGTAASAAARGAAAQQRAVDLASIISDLRRDGVASLHGLARGLNERGIPTARGGEWTAMQVKRVLSRIEAAEF